MRLWKKEINIAEILKDKPKGTKLYTDTFGALSIEEICAEDEDFGITLLDNDGDELYFYNNGKYNVHGEPILVPSKEMRDWRKFAWKRGDVLVNSCGFQCVFKEWASDDYTKFNGCYSNSRDGYEDVSNAETAKFDKLEHNISYGYVREIERKLGGKLNMETLEIEPAQPEFKDGDIITIMPHIGDNLIYLFKTEDDEKYYGHAYLDGNIAIINEDSYCQKDFCTTRPSTEKEKQQLFEALAKEGKRWNAEKKVIEDIKKEYQFKPFEKVLVRDSKDSLWHIDLYEGMLGDNNEYNYSCMAADWVYCIPYEGNEHLLGTTKDVEEDYEGNQE